MADAPIPAVTEFPAIDPVNDVWGQKLIDALLDRFEPDYIAAMLPDRLNDAVLGATYAAGKLVEPGNPNLTPGEVLAIGRAIGLPAGVNTVVLLGDGAPNYENVIGGVLANVNTPSSNIPPLGPGTGDGALPDQNGSWNVMLGGYDNVSNGWATVVLGFHNKVGSGANHITISGGSIHEVAAAIQHSLIAGGTNNRLLAGADYAVISGGAGNEVGGIYAIVGGGTNNKATARSSLVLGGEGQTASGNYATVIGGFANTASGVSSTVAGQSNAAPGAWSAAFGRDNLAGQESTLATGRGAAAIIPGERAHSASVFAAQGDAQHRQFVIRRQTTDATPLALASNAAGNALLLVPADTTWAFSARIVARRTDADNESAGYLIQGVVDRNGTASTIAFVGSPTVAVLGEDVAAWGCAVAVDTSNGSLAFQVTGEAAKTIRWVGVVDVTQVIG